MRVLLGGVRGTSPVSDRNFAHYGGATTCVLVEDGAGTRIVVDAGTGLRMLEPRLAPVEATAPVLMLFTHYHLDHLIGLPSFAPLYNPDWQIVFAAPVREGVTAEMALGRLIAAPFWPIAFRAQQRYIVLPQACDDAPFRHGPFDVRWCAVHHHNGCHAYRIDARDSGTSMVFATDVEWGASDAAQRAAFLRLCRQPSPVDLLIMDGHLDAAAGARFSGWGHSTWQDAVQVAKAADAGQLIVTHHAPESDDHLLARRAEDLEAAAAQAGLPRACLAREGMEIALVRAR
jgi:phosphoribosyl 1,2-cyclic phosphodiesterase